MKKILYLCCFTTFFPLYTASSIHTEQEAIEEIKSNTPPPSTSSLKLYSSYPPTITFREFQDTYDAIGKICGTSCKRNYAQLNLHIKPSPPLDAQPVSLVVNHKNAPISLYAFLIELKERLKIIRYLQRKNTSRCLLLYDNISKKKLYKHLLPLDSVLAQLISFLPHQKRVNTDISVFPRSFIILERPPPLQRSPSEKYIFPENNTTLHTKKQQASIYETYMNNRAVKETLHTSNPYYLIKYSYFNLCMLLISYGDLFLPPMPLSYGLTKTAYDPYSSSPYSLATTYSFLGTTILLMCIGLDIIFKRKNILKHAILGTGSFFNCFHGLSSFFFPLYKIDFRGFFMPCIHACGLKIILYFIPYKTKNEQLISRKITQIDFFLQEIETLNTKKIILQERTSFPAEIVDVLLSYSEDIISEWPQYQCLCAPPIHEYYENLALEPIISPSHQNQIHTLFYHKKCLNLLNTFLIVFYGLSFYISYISIQHSRIYS